ncbi:mechanosensitive ion channel family protein [Vampirovibrio chlorellavorus]|uniref:mechanosensitive ion channel family protein n=1 Tax=Vampirovibrio chlorellavorus TaxID=758823 RepID=UPI0026F07E14|nr:mechanosensitive ion channel family protein [Vampirovibrio chlorellavorus]
MRLYIPDELQALASRVLPLLDWTLWLWPVLYVAIGTAAGFLAERIMRNATHRLLSRVYPAMNGSLDRMLSGLLPWLFGLWGSYGATYQMPFLSAESLEIVRKALFIVAMLIAIRFFGRVSVALTRFYLDHTQALKALPNTSIFENIIRLLVFLCGSIVLLQSLGISVLPLITALGVGGLAISLALQDTLANMFAGIQMILARQIKVGDFVRLESGQEGFIQDIGWRNTVIRQLSNNLVLVPNAKMSSTIITNFALPIPEMSTLVEVSVGYASDLQQVERVIQSVAKEVLQRTLGAVIDFDPFIRYHTFGESGIGLTVILRIQGFEDQYAVKHEFIKALHARFQAEGIEIPFPRRVVHLEPQLRSAVLAGGV